MKKSIKALCIGLCAAVMISAIPAGTFAQEPDSSVIKGSFKTDGVEENYFYSDEYFSQASTVENMHLNTMSLVMSLTVGDKDIDRIFGETGFTDVVYGDMDTAPTKDTIGTVIARKNIDGQDLVVVAIRGTNYKNEWASNFIGGASGDAEGFTKASDKVEARVSSYIESKGLEDVKIWVTGYSRGGGVACLTGEDINEDPEKYHTKTEDVYVYAFESPMASTSGKKYDNIWCMRNRNDLVNYVYPEGWGFASNGRDKWIGEDKLITAKKFDLNTDGYFTDVGDVTIEDFIKETSAFMSDALSRENYSGECEQAVSTVVDIWNSKSASEQAQLKAFLKNDVLKTITNDTDIMVMLLNDLNNGIMKHENDKMYQWVADDICSVLDKAAEGGSMPLSDEEYALLKKQVYPILRHFGPIFVRDYIYREGRDYTNAFPESHYDPDYDPAMDPFFGTRESDESSLNSYMINAEKAPLWRLYHVSTAFKNIGDMINEHYGHTVFALVKTYDSYYPEYVKREEPSSKEEESSSSQGEKKTGKLGDVNGDGSIDVEDAVMVIGHVNGAKALTAEEESRADIDKNSDIDIEDAVAIIAHVNGVKAIV